MLKKISSEQARSESKTESADLSYCQSRSWSQYRHHSRNWDWEWFGLSGINIQLSKYLFNKLLAHIPPTLTELKLFVLKLPLVGYELMRKIFL